MSCNNRARGYVSVEEKKVLFLEEEGWRRDPSSKKKSKWNIQAELSSKKVKFVRALYCCVFSLKESVESPSCAAGGKAKLSDLEGFSSIPLNMGLVRWK